MPLRVGGFIDEKKRQSWFWDAWCNRGLIAHASGIALELPIYLQGICGRQTRYGGEDAGNDFVRIDAFSFCVESGYDAVA